jgi:hypothetical protein
MDRLDHDELLRGDSLIAEQLIGERPHKFCIDEWNGHDKTYRLRIKGWKAHGILIDSPALTVTNSCGSTIAETAVELLDLLSRTVPKADAKWAKKGGWIQYGRECKICKCEPLIREHHTHKSFGELPGEIHFSGHGTITLNWDFRDVSSTCAHQEMITIVATSDFTKFMWDPRVSRS